MRRGGRLLSLHDKHLGHGATAFPITWIDLLDRADLGLSIVLKLRSTVSDRTNIKVFLAEIDRDLRTWSPQIDPCAVAHCSTSRLSRRLTKFVYRRNDALPSVGALMVARLG
jgi:hypothetical protein